MKKGWRSRREYWAAQPTQPVPDNQTAPQTEPTKNTVDPLSEGIDAFLAILPKNADTQK